MAQADSFGSVGSASRSCWPRLLDSSWRLLGHGTGKGSLNPHPDVPWSEFGGIVKICAWVGVVVGTPVYLLGAKPFVPWPYLPIILIVAWVVAWGFAVVAALYASIALILLARLGLLPPDVALSRSVLLGGLSGAVAGGLHPFVIVYAIVAGLRWAERPFEFGGLQVAIAVMISGGIAGGLAVRRYGAKAAREPASHVAD